MTLKLLPIELAVWKAPTGRPLPAIPENPPGFWSLTRTEEEISIVSDAGMVPPEAEAQAGWRCFSIAGLLDFSLTGVLASLTAPLAEAEIPIFAISTYNTDHILIRDHQVNHAIKILESAGHTIEFKKKRNQSE
jgi:hypothetical protein